MNEKNKSRRNPVIVNILFWGSLWGIFEATAGYLLHLISFSYGWLLWYPFACFFMVNVYRKTGRVSSIFFTGLLCSSVKMLNLLLPGRIDRVINPAISIMFESLAVAIVIFAINKSFNKARSNPLLIILSVLSMNTAWRIMYICYLILLAPAWIRDISVISSSQLFVTFFITQNLITSALILLGYQLRYVALKPLRVIERQLSDLYRSLPGRAAVFFKISTATLMLSANISLQFILK